MLHCFYWILLQFLNSVLLTQTQITGDGDTIERDELIIELTTDILGKVPQPHNIQVVSEQYPVLYTNSMNTVLRQVSHQKCVTCLNFHISLLLDVQQILHQKHHVHKPCCLFVHCWHFDPLMIFTLQISEFCKRLLSAASHYLQPLP
jgi:hypothetical protein